MENSSKGIIFIVDISGYSGFVREMDNGQGAEVISALLQSIIGANHLSLIISEIEGDAILFYYFGIPFTIEQILCQFESMLLAFNEKAVLLKADYPQVQDLSIKLIVHYGTIEKFNVSGFFKLYGQVLIEAHRLLKNSIGLKTYVLVTENYQQALSQSAEYEGEINSYEQCDLDKDMGKLCYTFFTRQNLDQKFVPLVIK